MGQKYSSPIKLSFPTLSCLFWNVNGKNRSKKNKGVAFGRWIFENFAAKIIIFSKNSNSKFFNSKWKIQTLDICRLLRFALSMFWLTSHKNWSKTQRETGLLKKFHKKQEIVKIIKHIINLKYYQCLRIQFCVWVQSLR